MTSAVFRSVRARRCAGCWPALRRAGSIRTDLGESRLILSVGRTDYTKGGVEQLDSFERVLENNRDLHGKVRLMHVSVTANRNMSVYAQIQNDIEAAAGEGLLDHLDGAALRAALEHLLAGEDVGEGAGVACEVLELVNHGVFLLSQVEKMLSSFNSRLMNIFGFMVAWVHC